MKRFAPVLSLLAVLVIFVGCGTSPEDRNANYSEGDTCEEAGYACSDGTACRAPCTLCTVVVIDGVTEVVAGGCGSALMCVNPNAPSPTCEDSSCENRIDSGELCTNLIPE